MEAGENSQPSPYWLIWSWDLPFGDLDRISGNEQKAADINFFH
jgi:hypothetical protein